MNSLRPLLSIIVCIIALLHLPLPIATAQIVSDGGLCLKNFTAMADAAGLVASEQRYVTVTAYASVPEQTKYDGSPFITADSSVVHDGIIAANFLRFGTKVKMPDLFGDKIFEVHDRMNERFPYRVDVWMDSPTKNWDFGIHRNVRLVILKEAAHAKQIAQK